MNDIYIREMSQNFVFDIIISFQNDISITHMALQNLTCLGTCQNNHHETYYVQMKIFTVLMVIK